MLSRMQRPRLFPLSVLLTFGLALCGCAVPPDQGHTVDGVVMVAPPPLQVDVIPAPPQAGYVWLGGYWNWVGGRHEWVSGHWSAPRPGYHWVGYEWVRQGDGWRLRPGHWVRR
jgi:WXXGXW repeat (2 copies)